MTGSFVTVRFFSVLRDRVGASTLEMAVEPGQSTGDVLESVKRHHPEVARFDPYLRIALNARYVGRDAPVAAGDEIALLTPVSGG